jgi:hypothetical protein
VAEDDWRDAVRAERLRVDASLMEAGLMDRSRLQATIIEYMVLRKRVGNDLLIRANKALIAWKERQSALKKTDHMRLPVDDWRAWPRVAQPALAHRRIQYPVGQGGLHAGIVREHLDATHPTFIEAGPASVGVNLELLKDRKSPRPWCILEAQ